MKPMQYFGLSELLAPEILSVLSEDAGWMLIPSHVRYGLDHLRELYGAPITINSGDYKYSGVRPSSCATGAKRSAHKIMRGLIAFDIKCSDLYKLRCTVEDHFMDLHIAEVEDYDCTPTWTHIAFSAERPVRLRIIQP